MTESDASALESALDGTPSRVSGWERVFRGNRVLWTTAAVAVVCLVAGLLVGRFVIPGSGATAEVPEPGFVTVPVTRGELRNEVIIRADFGYVDATELTLNSSSGGTPVVTGQVPEPGDVLDARSVILEIAGRPVIALPGELPAYRTLVIGSAGPDVIQLKEALKSLGLNPGNVSSDVFDQKTADAVAALYAQAGYPVPPPPEGAAESLRAAQDGVRFAQEGLQAARRQLANAKGGPDPVTLRNADNAVAAAQDALDLARLGEPQPPWATPEMIREWENNVRAAERALSLALLERDQLFKPGSLTAERAAVKAAEQQVAAANEAVTAARQAMQAYLPLGEVVYLSNLPRRVDTVSVRRGDILGSSAVMTISGASLSVAGSAAEADARFLKVGDEGFFELPEGGEHRAVITELVRPSNAGERWRVLLTPDELTTEQIHMLQGSNIRLRISLGGTDGAVLQVPLAALSAGPGGVSRVEVVIGDPRDPRAETRIVEVETGLAAQGVIEVTPLGGTLNEGDLVVVGR